MTVNEIINKAVDWAVAIAKDDSHGYSQTARFGPDYDCSSLIIEAWNQAGVPVKKNGATFTGDMKQAFLKSGFVEVDMKSTERTRGDVLLNEKYHTAMMVDKYTLVNASTDENGRAGQGAKPGDQTGREILVRPYYVYSKGWDCCLRYVGNGSAVVPKVNMISVELPTIRSGSIGPAVLSLQILLNAKAGANLQLDSEYGPKTAAAIAAYQKSKGLTADSICGRDTWTSILNK